MVEYIKMFHALFQMEQVPVTRNFYLPAMCFQQWSVATKKNLWAIINYMNAKNLTTYLVLSYTCKVRT